MTVLRALVGGAERRGRVIGDDETDAFVVGGGPASVYPDNELNALSIPALWAGTRIIAETVGSIPLQVLFRTPAPEKAVSTAEESRLWDLLCVSANPEMDAGAVWEFVVACLILRGNAYLWKQRDGAGRVIALWPIRPDRVQVGRDPKSRRKVFQVNRWQDDPAPVSGTTIDILHIRGLGTDPLLGWSPIRLLRGLYNRAHGEAEYQGSLVDNGVRPSGVLKSDGKLSPESAAKLARQWRASYGGAGNAGKVPVLEEGIDWQAISLTAADAQLLQQRQYTRQEFAMVLNLPAHMLLAGEGGGLHYSSAAMDTAYFTQHTIRPHTTRIEKALRHDVDMPWFYTGPKAGYLFPKFYLDALSEADPATRWETNERKRRSGSITPNEIRADEGKGPHADGDSLTAPASGAAPGTEPEGTPE